jgi:hypothetical protein
VNLDETLVLAINHHLTGRWPALDALAGVVADSELVKGAVFVAALWYLWFRHGEHDTEARVHVLGALAGAFAAVVVARALALLLPFRARPYSLLGSAFVTSPSPPASPVARAAWVSSPRSTPPASSHGRGSTSDFTGRATSWPGRSWAP